MAKIHNFAAAIASIVFLSAASAQEKIESAFGLKLGDVFDISQATGKTQTKGGNPIYDFKPKNPVSGLTIYRVMVTPTTHKICLIGATGSAATTSEAKAKQAVIMSLLNKKYGESAPPKIGDAFSDSKRITQGTRVVETNVSGILEAMLTLTYCDAELATLAEKERIAIEAAKTDAGGL